MNLEDQEEQEQELEDQEEELNKKESCLMHLRVSQVSNYC